MYIFERLLKRCVPSSIYSFWLPVFNIFKLIFVLENMEVHTGKSLPRIDHIEVHTRKSLPRIYHMEVHTRKSLPRIDHIEVHTGKSLPNVDPSCSDFLV
jgi:hypothetical protein